MRDVARLFKALADESRLEILWLLFNNRELCVCDIVETLGITQSKASRHLATLRHARLVTDRREGTWSYYALEPPSGQLERTAIDALRTMLARRPGASRVMDALGLWLVRKKRDGACATAARARRASRPARGRKNATLRPRDPR